MPADVHPLLPLSLLEAVRALDQLDVDHETEYTDELRNKRLGLSDTVRAQVKRYREAIARGTLVPRAEVAAVARLLGRRPDADAVFRAAGRDLARASFATLSGPLRGALATLPSLLVRPLALRHLRRLALRFLDGRVRRVGGAVYLTVDAAVAAEHEQSDVGAVIYEAALREYVALCLGGVGAVERTKADAGQCYEWRTDWRAAPIAERRALRAAAARG